jgi:hypothetical protein
MGKYLVNIISAKYQVFTGYLLDKLDKFIFNAETNSWISQYFFMIVSCLFHVFPLEYINYIYEVFVNFIQFETNATFNWKTNKSKSLKTNQNASNFKMKSVYIKQ